MIEIDSYDDGKKNMVKNFSWEELLWDTGKSDSILNLLKLKTKTVTENWVSKQSFFVLILKKKNFF